MQATEMVGGSEVQATGSAHAGGHETGSPVALLNLMRKARELVDACENLLVMDLAAVPDDMLREATNDIFAIRELAGEIYEPIAFQLADNELAEIAAEEESPAGEDDSAGESDSLQPAASGADEPGDVVGNAAPCPARMVAAGLLFRGYTSLYRCIRGRGREKPAAKKIRQQKFAEFDALMAGMGEEDRRDLRQLEGRYQAHARRLHERVAAMLRFWELPEIAGLETHRSPPA